jgi:hypothetical protein
MVPHIRLLRCPQSKATHRIRRAHLRGHLHRIGAQGGVHGKVATPRFPRFLLNDDHHRAVGPRYQNPFANQSLFPFVQNFEEDVVLPPRLSGIIPQDLLQLVGIAMQVQREEGLDARIDRRSWLRLWLWLGFRLRLGFWLRLGFRLRLWLRFRFGFWFRLES